MTHTLLNSYSEKASNVKHPNYLLQLIKITTIEITVCPVVSISAPLIHSKYGSLLTEFRFIHFKSTFYNFKWTKKLANRPFCGWFDKGSMWYSLKLWDARNQHEFHSLPSYRFHLEYTYNELLFAIPLVTNSKSVAFHKLWMERERKNLIGKLWPCLAMDICAREFVHRANTKTIHACRQQIERNDDTLRYLMIHIQSTSCWTITKNAPISVLEPNLHFPNYLDAFCPVTWHLQFNFGEYFTLLWE